MEITQHERKLLRPQRGFQDFRLRKIDWDNSVDNPFTQKSANRVIYPCASGIVKDVKHGIRALVSCNRWECDYCGEKKRNWLLHEMAYVRGRHRGRFVASVLTLWGRNGIPFNKRTGKDIAYGSLRTYFKRFVKEASNVLETEAFVEIPEWQKSGVIHFNLIWFGVRRDYTDCQELWRIRPKDFDVRIQCGKCHSCSLRKIWERVTSAPRSTHSVGGGTVFGYATKYVTKSSRSLVNRYNGCSCGSRGDETRKDVWCDVCVWEMSRETGVSRRMRRYNFSRACKRPPKVIPIYQYLWNYINEYMGFDKEVKTPALLFLDNIAKYEGYSHDNWEGYETENIDCSEKHNFMCDPTPYYSRSQRDAYSKPHIHWEWLEKRYGRATVAKVKAKIRKAFILWQQYKRKTG